MVDSVIKVSECQSKVPVQSQPCREFDNFGDFCVTPSRTVTFSSYSRTFKFKYFKLQTFSFGKIAQACPKE